MTSKASSSGLKEAAQAEVPVHGSAIQCHVCSVKSMKRYKVGRSLRMHATAVHWPARLDEIKSTCPLNSLDASEEKGRLATFLDRFSHDAEEFTKRRLQVELEKAAKGDSKLGRRRKRKVESGIDFQAKHNKKQKRARMVWVSPARLGDVDQLQRLKDQGAWNWNDRDEHGSTAEHYAAGAGRKVALQYCLRLRFQSCERHQQLLKYKPFVPTGLSSDIVRQGAAWTSLVCTCETSLKKRQDGRASLHWAARNGHVKVVRFLVLECGADIEMGTFDGTSALMYAVFGAQVDAAKALVELGADPLRINDWGCDLTHWVAISKSSDQKSIASVCRWLSDDLGFRFDSAQKEGRTPLHKAAFINNVGLVDWLLNDYSRKNQKVELVKLLKARDGSGKLAADLAHIAGHEELARKLESACFM